ncbi:ankyrin repeat domain-containing protein SOWAHB-like [Lethenteron reissneri]|uniref:ankyrin repeat domain-containing protein SOWAHB-like n=1 Tax=Lethenteron reissneri TaxID=7753 RepID=UPI002AB70B1E|nr:ankyrin repeat domain-containing protein SOWAHB-like [Lethenteron reissneri]
MGDEPEFSQDGVLNFLVESGGRVANTELLHRFRGALGEPSARELFKGFVNAVGLVKQEDGAKYVVLKKKYKQHLLLRTQTAGVDGPRTAGVDGPRTAEAADRGGGDERADGTLLPSEQPPGGGRHSEQSAKQQAVTPSKAGEMTRIIALPSCASVDEERGGGGGGAGGDASSGGGGEASSAATVVPPPPAPVAISITVPSPAVDATGGRGPFAEGGLAAKTAAARRVSVDESSQGHAAASAEDEDEGTTTPGSRSEAAACTEAEGSGSQDAGEAGRSDSGEEGCRGESGPGGPDSSSQEVSSGATASVAAAAAVGADAGGGVGRGSFKTTPKNLSQGLRVPGSPQAKRHNSSSSSSPKSPFIAPNFVGGDKTGAGDSDTESVGSARTSEDDGAGGGGSSFGAPLALEPVEHEWIVSAARGDWSNLHGLLLGEPSLALRRDPLTGYTALHWAAKHGKADMVPVLVAAAESSAGTADDVNVRSHGGYTALHLAAMHGHTDVAKMLVGAYEANVNARDYSGRKPWHYLCQDASWEIRELLEAPVVDGAERPATTEVARRKLPRPYLGSLRIPSGHGGGAGSDDEADGGGGGGGNFLRDMQLMRRQSFAKLLKAPMSKKRHKTQIIHSSSSVRETRAKEEGDLPVGKVAL